MPSLFHEYLRIRRKSRRQSPSGPLRTPTPEPARPEATPSSHMIIPITSANNNAFAIALQRYLDDLDPDEQRSFQDAHQNIDPRHLLAKVASLDGKDKKSTSRRFMDRVESFLTILNTISTIVGVGIQGSPETSSLIVGGAKLVLDLALKFVEFFKKLTAMLSRLTDHLEHLQEISRHSDLPLIQNTAANVYGSILKFYHHAYHVFRSKDNEVRTLGHLRTFARVQWEPFESKFGDIDKDIENNLKVLGFSSQAVTLSAVRKLDDDRQRESAGLSKRLVVEERKKFLNWLSPSDFDSIQQLTLSKRWPKTGLWLLEHENFTTWFSNPASRLLWCNGPPGVGKSVLSSLVVDHIQFERIFDGSDVGLAFAYIRHDQFDSPSAENSAATYIIATLLKQLARRIESFPEELVEVFSAQYKNDQTPTLDFCVQSFRPLARQFTETFIVIDALDECNEISRALILDFIYDVTETMPSIKLFITSRRESTIAESFLALKVPAIEIHAKHVETDIEKYVNGRLDLLLDSKREGVKPRTRTLRLQDSSTRNRISEALLGNSHGIFLWVDLQLDNICRQKNDEDIMETLSSLPSELNETYARIFKQIRKESRPLQILARKCLMWVLNARRPLSLYELRDAVSTTQDCIGKSELEKKRQKYTMFDIMDTCKHLLVSEHPQGGDNYEGSATVRVLHYSVAEYLRTDNSATAENTAFSKLRDPIRVESELATTCIVHLRLVCLPDGPVGFLKEMRKFWSGSRDLFSLYCAWYFDEHLVSAEVIDPELRAHVDRLLSMEPPALEALARLRHMNSRYTSPNLPKFEKFDWQITSRTVILTSRLSDISHIRDDPRWCQMEIHPHAIHEACANGPIDQIRRLILLGSSPNTKDGSGESAYSIAISRGDVPVVELLLQSGADVNQTIGTDTALEIACDSGSLPLAKLLLHYGAKGVENDSTLSEALLQAIEARHIELARLLFDQGAKPTKACLDAAFRRQMSDIVDPILDACIDQNGTERNGASSGLEGHDALLMSIRAGNSGAVANILEKGYDLTSLCEVKDSPPLDQVRWPSCALVRLLIQHGANPNESKKRLSILTRAAMANNEDTVKTLVEAGAKINATGAFHAACYRADLNVVRYLLESGADTNETCEVNQGYMFEPYVCSPLHVASARRFPTKKYGQVPESPRIDIIRILLDYGAKVNAVDANECTSLQIICSFCRGDDKATETVQLLVDSGADVNARGGSCTGPLEAACGQGHVDVAKVLLVNGVRDDIQREHALEVAAKGGYADVVELLLEDGVDVHAIKGEVQFHRNSGSALRYAFFDSRAKVVDLLLGADANVDSTGYDGTAFEAALIGHAQKPYDDGGWGQVIKLLRARGVNEPREDCHVGVQCDGPKCSNTRKILPIDSPPEWIMGLRYNCSECENFDLCAGCRSDEITNSTLADLARGSSSVGETLGVVSNDTERHVSSYRRSFSHEPDHEMISFEKRKYFGEEETLGKKPLPRPRSHTRRLSASDYTKINFAETANHGC